MNFFHKFFLILAMWVGVSFSSFIESVNAAAASTGPSVPSSGGGKPIKIKRPPPPSAEAQAAAKAKEDTAAAKTAADMATGYILGANAGAHGASCGKILLEFLDGKVNDDHIEKHLGNLHGSSHFKGRIEGPIATMVALKALLSESKPFIIIDSDLTHNNRLECLIKCKQDIGELRAKSGANPTDIFFFLYDNHKKLITTMYPDNRAHLKAN